MKKETSILSKVAIAIFALVVTVSCEKEEAESDIVKLDDLIPAFDFFYEKDTSLVITSVHEFNQFIHKINSDSLSFIYNKEIIDTLDHKLTWIIDFNENILLGKRVQWDSEKKLTRNVFIDNRLKQINYELKIEHKVEGDFNLKLFTHDHKSLISGLSDSTCSMNWKVVPRYPDYEILFKVIEE